MREESENNTKAVDRLALFIDNQDTNFSQLAINIGLSNSYFSKMIKNNGSLGEDVIRKILLYYGNINSEWLITGKGKMLKSEEKDVIEKLQPIEENNLFRENNSLLKENSKLFKENIELREEIKRLKAQLESLGKDQSQSF